MSKKAKVLPGRYSITSLFPPSGLRPGQLYFTESNGAPKGIGFPGQWSIPRAIVADENWLYVNHMGDLYRVNPGDGTSEPFGTLRIHSLTRAIWIHDGWLYGTSRSEVFGELFVDIYRFKLSDPTKGPFPVASLVRMDVPPTEKSIDAEVFIDIPKKTGSGRQRK